VLFDLVMEYYMTILTSPFGGKFVRRRKLSIVWSFQAPFKVSYSACGWP